MTVSNDSKLERKKEQCEEYEEKASEALPDEPKKTAEMFLKAASTAKDVAELEDRELISERWRERGQTLEERAENILNQVEDDNSPTGADTGSDGSELVDQETEFFGNPPEKDLDDVGGLDELKQVLRRQVIEPLENPEFYEKQGVGINNGILLYGPPGTGKTHISEALAGELGFNYAGIQSSEIVSKYVGEAPQNVSQLFEEALSAEPCIVFLDEIDALAGERGAHRETRSERQMVNELLDGMQTVQGSQVLVIAATNTIDDIDGALKRSGRFNEKFFVGPPGRDARREIFETHLEKREVEWGSIDWQELLEWSEGFSGADIEEVVRKAARYSAEDSTEKDRLVPVNYRHLLEAVKGTEASLKHWDREQSSG